jgi:hypothetical protein
MKVEATGSSGRLIYTYKTARFHNPKSQYQIPLKSVQYTSCNGKQTTNNSSKPDDSETDYHESPQEHVEVLFEIWR